MNTIKISLKKTKFGNISTQTPFWFTSIKQGAAPYIHLSTGAQASMSVDLKTTPIEVLKEVYAGILSGDISVDKIELLMTHIGLVAAGASVKKEAVSSPLPETKEESVQVKVEEPVVQKDPLVVKAEELLKLSQAKLIDEVGSANLIDGVIPVGINDVKLLSTMLDIELEFRRRKKVIAMLQDRMELLKEESYMTITEEKETKLKLVGDKIMPAENTETEE